MMKLIASSEDPCVFKAQVAAKAAGVALTVEKGNVAVPEAHCGTKVVKYTNAILRCIGRVYDGGDIYGSTFHESAEVDSWLDWAQLELAVPEPPFLDGAIASLEQHLAQRTFLVGQRYSLADVAVSCSLHLLGGSLPKLPICVERWLGTCKAQEAFQAFAGSAKAAPAAGGAAKAAAGGGAAKAAAAGGAAGAKGATGAAGAAAASSSRATLDRSAFMTACSQSKGRRMASAPAFAKAKLIAGASDACVLKACVVAKAAGIDLEVSSGAAGVPQLQIGNKTVKYTNAILRCLARIYEDSEVYGSSFIEAGQIDSWLDWSEMELAREEPPLLDAAIAVLDKHLQSRTFIVGERFTIADASISCAMFLLQHGCSKFPAALPQTVNRWLGTCTAQEAFKAVAGDAAASAMKAAPAKAAAAGSSGATGSKAAPSAEKLVSKYSSCVGGRVTIKNIIENGKGLIGKILNVCGWARTMRVSKACTFVELNDGSSPHSLQVVLCHDTTGFDSLKTGCGTGASLRCQGKLVESKGKGQTVELLLEDASHQVVVLGTVDSSDYPMAKKGHSKEFLREQAHLRPRSLFISSMARVRNSLAHATHEFFRKNEFVYVHTPLITAADCEGAGEMFQVTTLMGQAGEGKDLPRTPSKAIDYSKDFFGKPAFLTVSGQLSVENYCCALSNVYTFGPTFRAENSHTSRHLAEFWMIEPELAFADINDDMQCAEDYLKYCVRYCLEHNRADLEFFENSEKTEGLVARLEKLIAEPFERLTYTKAIEVLQGEVKKGVKFEEAVEWGMDLGSEHERHLAENVYKKVIVLYNYPKDIKAFYMRLNDDNKTVAAMDVLVPQIGEVIGGSQREERLDVLDMRIKEMGLVVEDYWWYRDLRRYGSVPHAGFGLGFERLIMLTTGIENIRDVIPFPRFPGHAEF